METQRAANAGLPMAKNGGQTAKYEFFLSTLVGTKPLEVQRMQRRKSSSSGNLSSMEKARLYGLLSNRAHEADQTERPVTSDPFEKPWIHTDRNAPLEIPKKPGLSAKRRKLPSRDYLSFASINIEPPSHKKHDLTTMRYNIFPIELTTASKFIISQVNWSEVVLDAVGRIPKNPQAAC